MLIRKYGVTLNRVTEKDIELIRRKRNSSFVKRHMLFRETITKDMQKKWFKSVNNACNVYFLILHGKKKIGLTNSANINWKKRSAEGGIFLWDADYVGTPIPLIASLISFELFFHVFKLKYCFIKVLKNNDTAIKFNEMFGFKRISENPGKEYYDYKLFAGDYKKNIHKTLGLIQKISNDFTGLSEKDADFSKHHSVADKKLYTHLPPKWKKAALDQRPFMR